MRWEWPYGDAATVRVLPSTVLYRPVGEVDSDTMIDESSGRAYRFVGTVYREDGEKADKWELVDAEPGGGSGEPTK